MPQLLPPIPTLPVHQRLTPHSASTATIVRIVYIRQLQLTTDYSWFGINLVKWSMVEPAIGITAAAIATLRPLFTKFLSVSRSDLAAAAAAPSPSSYSLATSYTKESRPSGDSRKTASRNSSRTGPFGYSNEFAEMLGLSTYGVTTTVTAGRAEARGERRRRERSERERETGHRGVEGGDCESQTELAIMEGKSDEDAAGYGWDVGIKATTTVVIDG